LTIKPVGMAYHPIRLALSATLLWQLLYDSRCWITLGARTYRFVTCLLGRHHQSWGGGGWFYTLLHSLDTGLVRKICIFSSNSSNGAIIGRLFLPGRDSNLLFLSCPSNNATGTFFECDGNYLLAVPPALNFTALSAIKMTWTTAYAWKKKTNFSEIHLLMLNNVCVYLRILYHDLLLTHSVMYGQTDTQIPQIIWVYTAWVFTTWPPRISVKCLAYLIPGLNRNLKTGNSIAV
jgi:hypothetical protein